MGDQRRRATEWVIGGLAAVTCLVGLAAVVTWTGSSGSRPAVAAAASPATVTPPEATTSTTPPVPTTTAPASTTTVSSAPRPAPTTSTTTTIAPVGSISGSVAHKNGAPVAGARVTLDGPHGGTVATDDAGRYAFGDLPPGHYDISIFAEGGASACQPQQPCLAPAVAMEQRPVALQAGERHTEDWVYPYDSPPSYS